ncbi:hypothetical protein NQ176_g9539 [Zarea fungicola]|uniref:Uncharacterized protein n=1 Tax=Zarea fungicola TaxID=93591 RepID=A0ACC1ML06_9HYPO|nr:hypothetical protein NQ176_g9539 [Lecanicillium fungicola]
MADITGEAVFFRLPKEIRLMIYESLLQGPDENKIVIGNRAKSRNAEPLSVRRSTYHVQERGFQRALYRTTYEMKNYGPMETAIMAVNRRLYHEVAGYLYGSYAFHFGSDIEAVVPFLGDLSVPTLQALRSITVHKARPFASATDDSFWKSMCEFLSSAPKLRHLRIVLQGGRPRQAWDGPQELSTSDLRLLYATRNECLEWARQLAEARASVDRMEIEASIGPMVQPTTSEALIFAAFSASIETTLLEFMRGDLQMPLLVDVAN